MALTAAPAAAQRYPVGRSLPDDPADLVRSWYERFLNREPDRSAGIWIRMLQSGEALEAVLARILGSDEYYRVAHATPESFIQTLYQHLVYGGQNPPGTPDRPPDYGYWLRLMRYESREDVAYKMLMRYPQSWRPGRRLYEARPREDSDDYDYRRPYWRYRNP
jgi:hypothetical protein